MMSRQCRFFFVGIASTAGLVALLLLAGCGQRDAAAQARPPEEAQPEALALNGAATAQPDTMSARPAETAAEGVTIVDPGGVVEVKATKAGLLHIGAAKCKTCHAVQFTSWSAGAHAKRTPPLDCEGCHGAGSEYKTMAVMKDPAKARAAGLVMPGRDFCATCHKSGWTDDMLGRAHAHKAATDAK